MVLCFCKQKTAYEVRISDWSSDVCSSDLIGDHAAARIFGGWGKFDGTIKNERTGNYIGGYDGNYAYGINVLVEPTDRLQINLFGMYSRVNNRAVPLRQRPTSENNCGSETVWNGKTCKTLYCGPRERRQTGDRKGGE